jgi:putative acetyltransferase
MPLQEGVFPIGTDEYPRVVDVWEASVRATHHFVTEVDIALLRPLVRAALPEQDALVGVRGEDDALAGFIGVTGDMVEMLFIDPVWRGQGGGRRLLCYAVETLGATALDCNEQNEHAVGFYRAMGFEVVGRSERDGLGKPYPLLHMRLRGVRSGES